MMSNRQKLKIKGEKMSEEMNSEQSNIKTIFSGKIAVATNDQKKSYRPYR